jgi:hypothetical protein
MHGFGAMVSVLIAPAELPAAIGPALNDPSRVKMHLHVPIGVLMVIGPIDLAESGAVGLMVMAAVAVAAPNVVATAAASATSAMARFM